MIKDSKRISYILNVKNRVKHINKFFENYKKTQTAVDELIVIDGDSTDGTRGIIEQNKPLVDIFVSEPDLNGGQAFNKGILLASGKYIKQYPVDDIIYNLDEPVYYMNQNTDVDLLVLGGIKETSLWLSRSVAPPSYGERFEDVFRYGACGVGFLIRRSSIPQIGLFDTNNIANDREYVLRAIEKGKVRFLPGDFYWHGVFADSASVVDAQKWNKENLKLMGGYCSKKYYYIYRLKKMMDVFASLRYLNADKRLKILRKSVPIPI